MQERNILVHIFVSSTFLNMHKYRDMLINYVRPFIEEALHSKGQPVQINFIDLRWGIDERLAEDTFSQNAQILETCFQAINECNIFLGLYGSYRGTCIPKEQIDLLNAQYNQKFPYNCTITELERWYCMNIKENHTEYLDIFINDSVADKEIVEINHSIFIYGNSSAENLIDCISRQLLDIICSGSVIKNELATKDMVLRKEYIDRIIMDILEDDDKPDNIRTKLIFVYGESGIGKSVLLSQVQQTIITSNLLTSVYLEDTKTNNPFDRLMSMAFEAYRITDCKECNITKQIEHLRDSLDFFRIPCFIIDSIDDISTEQFYKFLFELNTNFHNSLVITATSKQDYLDLYDTYNPKIIIIENFSPSELEASISRSEYTSKRKFPSKVRQKLLSTANTIYAKPLLFELILNDLSLMTAKDYEVIMGGTGYSSEVEKIMLERFSLYSDSFSGIIAQIWKRIVGINDLDNIDRIETYMALILLSYKGINESFISQVIGKSWNPLSFYQMKMTFRSLFNIQNEKLKFSHDLVQKELWNIIRKEKLTECALQIVHSDLTDSELLYEKVRMFFFLHDYDAWYSFIKSEIPEKWQWTLDALAQYCLTQPPFGCEYLSVPNEWMSYLSKKLDANLFGMDENEAIISLSYELMNIIRATASASRYSIILKFCRTYILFFKMNIVKFSGDEVLSSSYKKICKHFYESAIWIASELAIHEQANEIVKEYENLRSELNYDKEEQIESLMGEKVMLYLWEIYGLAKYKEETDFDSNQIIELYTKILQISKKYEIVFPNFGAIAEFMIKLAKFDIISDYTMFAYDLMNKKLETEGGLSFEDMQVFIRLCHTRLLVDTRINNFTDIVDAIFDYILKEYAYAKHLYDMHPDNISCMYDYSMSCSDLYLVYKEKNEVEKAHYLLEENRKIKHYMYQRNPDIFFYANSYSVFLSNYAQDADISTEQRFVLLDELFQVLTPFIVSGNVHACWVYLLHWRMIYDSRETSYNQESVFDDDILKKLEKHLKHLLGCLNSIYQSNEHSIKNRSEVLHYVSGIYNMYRRIASRPVLRELGIALYQAGKDFCELNDDDSSYHFLATAISTVLADQAVTPEMDDFEILKEYQRYIEEKIQKTPERVVLHESMLIIPQTEIMQMIGMLAGIEHMPEEAQLMMKMAWEHFDINPYMMVCDSAEKMIARMKIIANLGGSVPKNSCEILRSILISVNPPNADLERRFQLLLHSLEALQQI